MSVNLQVEFPTISAICFDRGLDPYFIAAVRVAENGGPGREFGVLDGRSNTYAAQLRVCTRTILGLLLRYDGNPYMMTDVAGLKRVMYTPALIAFVGRSYCPAGADNDPTGLNVNWYTNVVATYTKLVRQAFH